MKNCIPCKTLKDCIQFADFVPSNPTDKIYLSTAQAVAVTCPSGTTATVNLDGGLIGYALTFTLGNPPYPDLVLNCSNSTITIPVPDNTTQAQLDTLIMGMINQCLQQIALNIGCVPGVFFNTQQTVLCSRTFNTDGATPAGVVFDSNSDGSSMSVVPGTIESTISIADANAKALLVLNEILSTGNVVCSGED